jgi:hypothetical protein
MRLSISLPYPAAIDEAVKLDAGGSHYPPVRFNRRSKSETVLTCLMIHFLIFILFPFRFSLGRGPLSPSVRRR